MVSRLANLFAFLLTIAPAAAKEPKLYALVIGDVTPAALWGKLLPNITLDVLAMQVLLWENLPEERLQLISLTLPARCSPFAATESPTGAERIAAGGNAGETRVLVISSSITQFVFQNFLKIVRCTFGV